MNKPYISVIFPIMRPGGLDIVFNSLERQTFKEFELVICDSLYEYRKDIVKEKASKFTFQYKHITPIIDKFPIQAYCHAMNSAITHVSGDVILFTTDYRYFMPDTLQKHADFHKKHPDNVGYAPASRYMHPPISKKQGLPFYGSNNKYNEYVQDLKNGTLQQYMWSIFEDYFFEQQHDPSQWEEMSRNIGFDPKTNITIETEVPPTTIFLQSESVKTKIVLKANGLNEQLDGAHSHQDFEFSHRLRNLFDFKWLGDNTNILYKILGGHDIVNKIKLIEDADKSAISIFEKYRVGSKEIPNDWSLSEAHSNNNLLLQ